MALKTLKLGKIKIGEKHPPIFLPDIGTFFNKDLNLAKKLIKKLIISGAEVIKGEVLHDPRIVINSSFMEPYLINKGKIYKEKMKKIIDRKFISLSKYEKIFSFCNSKKIPFVLSVYDFEGANFAYDIGACGIKIASSNLLHKPLIEHVIKFNIPIFLDTGKASMNEIVRSVGWFKKKGFNKLHIQHSPYPPPSPIFKHDLNMIKTFKKKFKLSVGLSDHHKTEEMLYAAIALGASTIEKGIISNEIKNDIDVFHALNVDNFKIVNQKCKNIFFALGKYERNLKKKDPRHSFRMCITSNAFLKKNTRITLNNINFAFPNFGISVENTDKILGKKIKRDIKKNAPIKWSDID